ncbi:SDR family NAD(P)-dependent oxidoreductase [Amycolatopsis rubida]|uniref:SDR family NAD(P)-dependent oxidoreductase n=1 Tax=Amycolatopsis TaxID=1813 RepID=UPI0007DFF5B5|nr:General stress protein 39 [Amycolatopsis sp. M39]
MVAAGHTVYAARGRQTAKELGARTVQLDVTGDASVLAAAKTVEADGGLDVLVNNAGIAVELKSDGEPVGASEVTADLMRETFETNVFGVVRVLRAFLPLLQRSSAHGVAYPASKAAVNMVTVQYAKAFPGIRINAVEPGYTRTDINGRRGEQSVEQGAEIIVRMAQLKTDRLAPTRTSTVRWCGEGFRQPGQHAKPLT